jgi:hypothetical protein
MGQKLKVSGLNTSNNGKMLRTALKKIPESAIATF